MRRLPRPDPAAVMAAAFGLIVPLAAPAVVPHRRIQPSTATSPDQVTAPGQREPPGPLGVGWTRIPLLGGPGRQVIETAGTDPDVPTAPGADRESPTLRLAVATARFSAIGVTWEDCRDSSGLSVAVRPWLATVQPSRRQLGWQLVPVSGDQPAPGAPGSSGNRAADAARRCGTELTWTGSASGFDVSVTLGSSPPAGLAVDLIDPRVATSDATAALPPVLAPPDRGNLLALARDAGTGGASARIAMPPVTRRAMWRAGEQPLRRPPEYRRAVDGYSLRFVHLAVEYQQSDVPRILRSLLHYRTVCRGWGDLGFLVLADKFGRLWEGQAGGLSRQAGDGDDASVRIVVLTGDQPVGGPAARQPLDQSSGQATAQAVARFLAWRIWLAGQSATPDPWRLVTVIAGEPAQQRAADGVRHWLPLELAGLRSPGSHLFAEWNQQAATWRLPEGTRPILAGTAGDQPVAADYDADGASDLATFSPGTGQWRYLASATGRVVEFRYGAPGELPVPADYDGDGAVEPATWSPAGGGWRIGGAVLPWGQPGDVPVPGDYDGDGAAEPAVWRPATGEWHLRGIGVVRLGSPWQLPVPADYDGNGAIEPACWSPVSHRWFVANADPVTFGEDGDTPVPVPAARGIPATMAVLHPENARFWWRALGSSDRVVGTVGEVPVTVG